MARNDTWKQYIALWGSVLVSDSKTLAEPIESQSSVLESFSEHLFKENSTQIGFI